MLTQKDEGIRRQLRVRMVRNFLPVIILCSLEERGMSGYEIMGALHEKFEILLSPGTVYPVLSYMEARGWIEGIHEERKKVYHLTEPGALAAHAMKSEYLNLSSRMEFYYDLRRPLPQMMER